MPVKQERVADVIVRQLQTDILAGVFPPGEKLPSERDLASRFDVSRPSVREALHHLAIDGMVETRQGGGTFVKDFFGPSLMAPMSQMLSSTPHMAYDYVEFRMTVESQAAYFAAQRSTEADREKLTACFEAMQKAFEDGDNPLEEELDADFHLAIAEASHNAVLFHVMHSMVGFLREGVIFNRRKVRSRPGAQDLLIGHHRAIYENIMNGRAEAASDAARAHLSYLLDVMREMEREDFRKGISQRRLERYNQKSKRG